MNNSIVFTFELAQRFYTNTEEFPVDFELAWQWLGYATKASAKRKLVKHFRKALDYKVFNNLVENLQGGRPEETIWLTYNCLKASLISL